MARILVIEDDDGIAEPLAKALGREGHDLRTVGCAADVERAVSEHRPELVVLDLGLPDGEGIDVCRRLRSESSDLGILILSGRRDELDTVETLDAGADDYVTKPFRLAELLARVRVRLRSTTVADLRVLDLRLDLESRRAWQGETQIHLSAKEFGVLAELARRPGAVVTREHLMDTVWGPDWFGPTKTLDVHVAWLRKKLGDDVASPRYIATIRGVGYRLERTP
jgi:DNA-binding response OmpR family regulator